MTMASSKAFREAFNFGSKELTHWFPSHMARSMKKMQGVLRKMDCVIEVHDARIPFSGRNPLFDNNLAARPHLLVLNKRDLADPNKQQSVIRRLKDEGIENVLYTNCRHHNHSIKVIVPKLQDMLRDQERYLNRENDHFNIMVIGVPNVGKSSLINALRGVHLHRGKASAVGARPGVTRAVMNRVMVCAKPPIYVLDTPGIMTPNIGNPEEGMKLALLGTLLDHKVGEDLIADYLLFTLNKQGNTSYVDHYNLDGPSDEIFIVLSQIARNMGKTQMVRTSEGLKERRLDLNAAASKFLRDFRQGVLGKFFLD